MLVAFALALLSGARCSTTWRARFLTLTAYLFLVPMHISWPTHALAVSIALAWPWFAPFRPDRHWRCRLTLHWAFAVGHLLIHSARHVLLRVAFMMGCLLLVLDSLYQVFEIYFSGVVFNSSCLKSAAARQRSTSETGTNLKRLRSSISNTTTAQHYYCYYYDHYYHNYYYYYCYYYNYCYYYYYYYYYYYNSKAALELPGQYPSFIGKLRTVP